MNTVLRTMVLLQIVMASSLTHAEPRICIEAESSTNVVSLMQVGSSTAVTTNKAWSAIAGASGGAYIEIPQSSVTNNLANESDTPTTLIPGAVSYEFTTAASGTHHLWCRVWWLDACGNSVSISIDGARPFSFGQDRTFKAWHWVKAPSRLKQLDLSEGRHSIVIAAREDGIAIDQILLTDDEDFVPVGIEDVTDTQESKAAKSNGP